MLVLNFSTFQHYKLHLLGFFSGGDSPMHFVNQFLVSMSADFLLTALKINDNGLWIILNNAFHLK